MKNVLWLISALLLFGCASTKVNSDLKVPLQFGSVQLSGGRGTSIDDAIMIRGAVKHAEVVDAEYRYMTINHGQRHKKWDLVAQTVLPEEKRMYDMVEIKLHPDSTEHIYYFDITCLQRQ